MEKLGLEALLRATVTHISLSRNGCWVAYVTIHDIDQ